jgi:hypothetical protein
MTIFLVIGAMFINFSEKDDTSFSQFPSEINFSGSGMADKFNAHQFLHFPFNPIECLKLPGQRVYGRIVFRKNYTYAGNQAAAVLGKMI